MNSHEFKDFSDTRTLSGLSYCYHYSFCILALLSILAFKFIRFKSDRLYGVVDDFTVMNDVYENDEASGLQGDVNYATLCRISVKC